MWLMTAIFRNLIEDKIAPVERWVQSTVVESFFPQGWEREGGVWIPGVLAVLCFGLFLGLTLCIGLTVGPVLWPVKRRFMSTSALQLTPHERDQEHSFQQSVKFTAPPIMEGTAAVVVFTPHERVERRMNFPVPPILMKIATDSSLHST